MPIDHVLKLYSESIRSPYLHYGFWDHPENVNVDNISLDEMVAAQGRYIEHLTSFIPEDVKTVLDVGAGIGGNSSYLLSQGYSVEALSPDEYQESVFAKKYNGEVKFHRTKFEDFEPEKQYDLVLESESACYIQIETGWKTARKTIRDGGYLLASDYFLHHNDGSGDWHIKAAHDEKIYMEKAKEYGFKLIREYDQTENTMPTLDGAKAFMERFIYPTVEFSSNYLDKKHPFILKVIKKAFGKKVNKKLKQFSLLESDDFRKYKRYMIYLFQKVD
ncbi:MAG: methyltransferase domain-containing protein [Candidatus Marinimicrobia bacterium]|jgi:MPBQ/MSBQ methyltransferase|nr:methyltransferase domain-containing protein [Candidatus Neomarinimicrobiota bacterium]MBT3676737.1 methyltransferase domain-containing protein [Candidatus Neomarinimicrobiota bacterium]MBT3764160.1 methyltransferase domain-containing protein [Candidatus Neomarinimicrobiota bacterium]MBT4068530.1 methyltransferase domain-containing protein [Candidatus Neomarinimicrobiota bacterium]MBT4271427.1 methyltransferase domain-containing protein [Candidatus Neomarinimicrobiota bacterium]